MQNEVVPPVRVFRHVGIMVQQWGTESRLLVAAASSMSCLFLVSCSFIAKVPNISWDDVGGLEDVKRELQETVQVPHCPML